jgi:electron transfer flavoprotein alpha subunit
MTTILVFGDVENNALSSSSLQAVKAAQDIAPQLSAAISGAILGYELKAIAEEFSRAGLAETAIVDDARLAMYNGDYFVAAAKTLIERARPDIVVFPHNGNTVEWVPRLAARMKASLAMNATALGHDGKTVVATRPVCGGALMADYSLRGDMAFVTIAPSVYPKADLGEVGAVVAVELGEVETRITALEVIADDNGTGPSLKEAKVIVSGGLGLGSKENWRLVEAAAAATDAAVGASRAAVESGWVSPSRQVGFSGAKVSPEVYIAVGISGAIHHLAGISTAKKVVAINKDPEANIFKIAHLGVVGDLNEVLPAFTDRVLELKAGS